MNSITDDNTSSLRYSEYALGVLDRDGRLAVEQEMQASDDAAKAVAWWQERLVPLADDIADAAPAPYVWARIQDALKLDRPANRPVSQAPASLWNSLPLWRWLSAGGAALALACLVVIFQIPERSPAPSAPSAPAAGYMVSVIAQQDGSIGWTATMDLQRGRLVVAPVHPQAFHGGQAPELWLLPPGGKPIAVGMITLDRPTTLTLSPALTDHLGAQAALAVSVEPPGGSPTGQPTGAVIAKGAISGAPATEAPAVKVADAARNDHRSRTA